MTTIKVTETCSDWFHTVDKVVDEKKYRFRLKAQNLVWMLEGFKGEVREVYYQIEQPKKLIKELNINEVIGNRYRTVKELIL